MKQADRIDKLEDKVEAILTNHLPHIQSAIDKNSADLDWLKRFFWLIFGGVVASLVASIMNLVVN